jgi:hypothetical protein
MGLNIGALGNFAGGVAKGMTAYQEQALREKEMAMREEALAMQKKKFGWEETEQNQKVEYNDLLKQAFGMDAPDKVGNANINPTNFAGGLSYQNAQGQASTAIPIDDEAILAHAKTLPTETADLITEKAKAAGNAASDPAEAQRLRTQAYKSLVAENMASTTTLPVKPPTDLNAPATAAAAIPTAATATPAAPAQAAAAIPTAATATPAAPAQAAAPAASSLLANDPYFSKIQKLKDLAMQKGNGLALDKALDMESKYTQTLANQQTIKLGDQTLTLGEFKIREAKTTDEFNQRFNTVMADVRKTSAARLDQITSVAQTDGLKGLVDTFGPELKKALGHDVQFKNGAIVVLDDKGKPIGQPITSIDQAQGALQDLARSEYANNLRTKMLSEGLFKNENELAAFLQKEQELKNQGISATAAASHAQTAADELAAKKQAGVFQAQANQANASAGMAREHTLLYGQIRKAAAADAATREALQEPMGRFAALSEEDQNGPRGRAILAEMATIAAKTSKDVAATITALARGNKADQIKDPKLIEQLGKSYAEELQAATTPEQIIAIKRKYAEAGLNTGYIDPLKTALPKPGENLNPDAGKNKTALPIASTDNTDAAAVGGGGTYTGNPDKEAAARQAKFKADMAAAEARIKAEREARQARSRAIPQ